MFADSIVDSKDHILRRLYGREGAIEKIYLLRRNNPHVMYRLEFTSHLSRNWRICPNPYYWPNLLPVGEFCIRIPETEMNDDLRVAMSTRVNYDGVPHILVSMYRERGSFNYVYINNDGEITIKKGGYRV